jgi:hypothetical protein
MSGSECRGAGSVVLKPFQAKGGYEGGQAPIAAAWPGTQRNANLDRDRVRVKAVQRCQRPWFDEANRQPVHETVHSRHKMTVGHGQAPSGTMVCPDYTNAPQTVLFAREARSYGGHDAIGVGKG